MSVYVEPRKTIDMYVMIKNINEINSIVWERSKTEIATIEKDYNWY